MIFMHTESRKFGNFSASHDAFYRYWAAAPTPPASTCPAFRRTKNWAPSLCRRRICASGIPSSTR